MGVSWHIFSCSLSVFCVGIVRVITALVRLLCKLIIHAGYVTDPGPTLVDTHRLCRRQQVTTREETGLLKSARKTLYTRSAAFLLHHSTTSPLHRSLAALSASTEVYSLSRTYSEELISHTHMPAHTHQWLSTRHFSVNLVYSGTV